LDEVLDAFEQHLPERFKATETQGNGRPGTGEADSPAARSQLERRASRLGVDVDVVVDVLKGTADEEAGIRAR
jgi:hypothetical protein